jgi:hypothetical protein
MNQPKPKGKLQALVFADQAPDPQLALSIPPAEMERINIASGAWVMVTDNKRRPHVLRRTPK